MMGVRWDSYALDIPGRRLHGPDGDVHVEPQVFDVLAYLVAHRERVVEKAELLDQVWGDQFVSESALTTRIKQVRRAVGDDGRTQRVIRNVHGRGYQFIGEIEPDLAAPPARHGRVPVERRPIALALSIALDDEFPFVGRDAELELIDQLLNGPESAQILIGGAPGMGKSRLAIQALERLADRGVLVCAGRCEEQVTSALQPIRDVIGQIAMAHPADFPRWSAGLEGPLASLIPSLGLEHESDAPIVDGYAGMDVLFTVFDRAAEDHEIALLIDDLQWSDQPTRAFLSYLHRRSGRPTFTIASFRSSSADLRPAARQWIGEQSRLKNTTRIDVEQLDDRAATQLVEAVLGSPGDAGTRADQIQHLLDRTGGHALFLTESLRDHQLGVDVSGSIADLVTARLERLDPNVKNLVEAGAIIGPEFTFSLAVEVAQLDPTEALDAIDVAINAELLHETASANRFRFSHQLVPEAIRQSMSRAARAQIHHRCASALITADGDEMEIAVHTLGAIPLVQTEAAIERGLVAAESARQDKEFDRSIRLLELCLEVEMQTHQRAEILLRLGDVLVASGRTTLAVPLFEEAAQLARKNNWPEILVRAALGHYGRSPFRKPADRSTLALLDEALAALGDEPSTLKARVLSKIAAFSTFVSPLSERMALTQEALDMAVEPSTADRKELLESRAIVLTCPAGAKHLVEVQEELEALCEEMDVFLADAAVPESLPLMHGDGARLRQTTATDEFRIRVQPIAEWRDIVTRSTFAAFASDFDTARELCDDAGRIGDPYWGDSTTVLHAFGHLFISSLSNEWDTTIGLLETLASVSDSTLFLTTLAWAQAAAGHEGAARTTAQQIKTESFQWLPEHILGGNVLIAGAEAGLLLDDNCLISAAEEQLEPLSDLILGVPWACSLAAADPLSRIAARRGDHDATARYEAVARRLYTSLDAPALLARLP